MMVPPFLLRLMQRLPLSAPLRAKLGPEDRLAVEIADACRAWTLEGRLKAVFWHTPNEGGGSNRRKAQIELATKGALGMISGTPDLVFIGGDRSEFGNALHNVLLMELKAPQGVMSKNQKDFQFWAGSLGVRYVVIKTFEAFERELVEAGMLSPGRGAHIT